jgi:hypothetical protein
MKGMQLVFLALGSAFVAIPGISALLEERWWPPGAEVFRIAVTVAGAGVLGMMMLARRSVLALSEQAARSLCLAAFGGALVLLFVYHVALHRAVVSYTYERTRQAAVIPFGVGGWASEPLKEVLQAVDLRGADPPASRHDVTWRHVALAYEQLGPDGMAPFIPRARLNLTLGLLLLLYCAVVSLIVLAFTTVAIRFGEPPAEEGE